MKKTREMKRRTRLAAPQANLVVDQTDFYDQTAAFTWGRVHR